MAQAPNDGGPESFIGYSQRADGTFTASTCDPSQFRATSGDYVVCQETGLPLEAVFTSCTSNTVFFADISSACFSTYDCHSLTIWKDESQNTAEALTNIYCGDPYSTEFYLTPPFSSVLQDISNNIFTQTTVSLGPISSSSNSSGTNNPNTPPSASSESKAWIAGAVIGPLGLIALIVGIWFLLRRYRKKNAAATVQNTTTHPPPYQPTGFYKPELAGAEGGTYPTQPYIKPELEGQQYYNAPQPHGQGWQGQEIPGSEVGSELPAGTRG